MPQVEIIFTGEPPPPAQWDVTTADLARWPEYDARERAIILQMMDMTTEELDAFIPRFSLPY